MDFIKCPIVKRIVVVDSLVRVCVNVSVSVYTYGGESALGHAWHLIRVGEWFGKCFI